MVVKQPMIKIDIKNDIYKSKPKPGDEHTQWVETGFVFITVMDEEHNNTLFDQKVWWEDYRPFFHGKGTK